MRYRFVFSLVLLVAYNSANAHFPFIVADEGGATAKLYMSETLEPDSEVSIDLLAGSKLSIRRAGGKDAALQLAKAEHSMTLALPGDGTRVVHGMSDLGIHQRGESPPHLLIYHPKAIIGDPFDKTTVLGDAVPVEIVPQRVENGFKLLLVKAGKPAAGAELRLINSHGEQENLKTDEQGLTQLWTEPGRYGAWARYWIDEPGERDGKPYKQVRHYATLVFDFSDPAKSSNEGAKAPATPGASRYPSLPQAVASFGAVESDGWLYVYGGHTAKRHDYSTASVSGGFHRLNLAEPSAWEPLPGGIAVQGMNLAAHKGLIYRAGGMEPRNAPGEPEDNHSIDRVERYDPKTNRWESLPPLPTPRSSHDLAFIDDKLYVVGGWHMKGKDEDPVWLISVDILDTASHPLRWQSIPQPFTRRALILAATGDRLYVMGGMDQDNAVQRQVDVLDVASGQWSAGPVIPGNPRDGFSPAACVFDSRVYLSIGSGALLRLNTAGDGWDEVARTSPRIVHRMVANRGELLLIGGASRANMLDLLETVSIDRGGVSVGSVQRVNPAAATR